MLSSTALYSVTLTDERKRKTGLAPTDRALDSISGTPAWVKTS